MNAGSLVIDIGARPFEPYPPEGQTAKRDEEDSGSANGKPFPLHIKNTDVATCLDRLEELIDGMPGAKETDLNIVHAETGRVVAKGGLEVH